MVTNLRVLDPDIWSYSIGFSQKNQVQKFNLCTDKSKVKYSSVDTCQVSLVSIVPECYMIRTRGNCIKKILLFNAKLTDLPD